MSNKNQKGNTSQGIQNSNRERQQERELREANQQHRSSYTAGSRNRIPDQDDNGSRTGRARGKDDQNKAREERNSENREADVRSSSLDDRRRSHEDLNGARH